MKSSKFSFLFFLFILVAFSFNPMSIWASPFSLANYSEYWKKPHTLRCVAEDSNRLVLNIDLVFVKEKNGDLVTYFSSRWRNNEFGNEDLSIIGDNEFNFHPEKARFYGSAEMSLDETIDFPIGINGASLKLYKRNLSLIIYSKELDAYAHRKEHPEKSLMPLRKKLILVLHYFEDQNAEREERKITFNCTQTKVTFFSMFKFWK